MLVCLRLRMKQMFVAIINILEHIMQVDFAENWYTC